MIWVCILCRKKQELVVKTGQWILPTNTPMQPQQQTAGNSGSASHLANDKRPRLERALSYERDTSGHANRVPVSNSSSSFASAPATGAAYHHAPLQRSGSLQSHGPSSWRPAAFSCDVNQPANSRGYYFPLYCIRFALLRNTY